jgi:hypothetical protein
MNAFFAITDRDGVDFFAARKDVDEANFWQPRAGGRWFSGAQSSLAVLVQGSGRR